jgi:teichuronic acid biosynthesis glycosyltransferase TuaC
MNLTVVAKNYPTNARPHQGTFLYALVQQLCHHGQELSVISPQPIRRAQRSAARYGEERASVIRPQFVSMSVRRAGPVRMGRLTSLAFQLAAERAAGVAGVRPDLVYGHFLFQGGDAAVALGRRFGVPSVIALGESDITRYEKWLGLRWMRRTVQSAAGILCVSNAIAHYCRATLGVPEEKILVLPNSVDCSRFRPMGKRAAREALKLPSDRPIVSFVGHFSERKGVDRVMRALKRTTTNPQAIFLGTGRFKPTGDNVLHAGPVPHADVPTFLAASDLFLLPTLAEGSCNSVLEALACGLPVVTSSIPAIYEDVGCKPPLFLVDPLDVSAIAGRVDEVLTSSNELRAKLASDARRIAESRSLRARSEALYSWLSAIKAATGGADGQVTGDANHLDRLPDGLGQ